MDSAIDDHRHEATPPSLRAAWQYGKQVWKASSHSDAWLSFQKMMEAMPVWALVVFIAGALATLAHAWLVVIPLAAIAFLMATFVTVKRAMLSALREHDARHQDS